ncbi:MAG: hypothetical protein OXE59_09950 [Bacteroidetes bacterium]|nr:hypothetical protein [Bacteroidota bacterium]
MKQVLRGVVVISVFVVSFAEAQDTLKAGFEVIADISDARALAVDQDGLLYVVSASTMFLFNDDGQLITSLDGTSGGVFGELTDIDPGNGLIWVLADFDFGSLHRFSKELLHLETIRIPSNSATELGRSPRVDLRDEFATTLGQPIAVSTGQSGEIFAIDVSAQHVIKWDNSRRLERKIGEFGTGDGQLVEPIRIATDATSVYVADRSLRRINIYDYFGGYERSVQTEEDVKHITVFDEELWIVYTDQIMIYKNRRRLSRQMIVELDDSLIAAEPTVDFLFLLTSNQLIKVKI